MSGAYYNDNDPFCAAWLRELIKAGLIAPGEVDERSIEEVKPDDLRGFTQCHFFAGIGGWSYALRLAGWPDDRPVWTGSCPCQPFSETGKRLGTSDRRHLWPYWRELIRKCRPIECFGEQVAGRRGLAWLDIVFADLEATRYSCGAVDLCAASAGAPHIRPRLFFVAHTNRERLPLRDEPGVTRKAPTAVQAWGEFERVHATSAWSEWDAESPLRVFASRVPTGVGRLRGFGNSIVPAVAKAFIEAYMSI